jgi:hypothetical protein
MAISPPRAFALGVCSVFVLAGIFVAGIAIGRQSVDHRTIGAEPLPAERISCPAAPGFTATKASNDRHDNCADAAKIQEMLLAAGALAANVSVHREDGRALSGPESAHRRRAGVPASGERRLGRRAGRTSDQSHRRHDAGPRHDHRRRPPNALRRIASDGRPSRTELSSTQSM